jgi:predicted histidine transporter YuiF (NhaC family)
VKSALKMYFPFNPAVTVLSSLCFALLVTVGVETNLLGPLRPGIAAYIPSQVAYFTALMTGIGVLLMMLVGLLIELGRGSRCLVIALRQRGVE